MPSSRLERVWDALRAVYMLEPRSGMWCVECLRRDDGERGWRIYLDCDGNTVAYCADCASREFDDA